MASFNIIEINEKGVVTVQFDFENTPRTFKNLPVKSKKELLKRLYEIYRERKQQADLLKPSKEVLNLVNKPQNVDK